VLLEAGAHKDSQNADGWNAMHEAAYHNHPELIEMLLSAGASTKLQTVRGLVASQLTMNQRIRDMIIDAEEKLVVGVEGTEWVESNRVTNTAMIGVLQQASAAGMASTNTTSDATTSQTFLLQRVSTVLVDAGEAAAVVPAACCVYMAETPPAPPTHTRDFSVAAPTSNIRTLTDSVAR
jgi:ankyrin repeat protein